MKNLLILITLLLIPKISFSQDIIVTKNGNRVECFIIKQDSSKVCFNIIRDGKKIETYLNMQDIEEIISEYTPTHYASDFASFGIGTGLNYGGAGINCLIYPQKNFGFFVAGGITLAGVTYNTGIKLRLIKKLNIKTLVPTLTVMQGCNTVVFLRYGSNLNKIYYGMTLGLGVDAHFKKNKKGYWSFDVFCPIRNPEIYEYVDDLKERQSLGFRLGWFPITLSAGYRFF